MSDVKCVVCFEPWDYWGMLHGDMLQWESELFRKGAGCPCCEGVIPEGGVRAPETLEDIENGDADPMERLQLFENVTKRPEWIRPEDPVLWTCKGCGVEVIRNVDHGEIEYHLPYDAKAMKWHNSHDFNRGTPKELPRYVFMPDAPVCEFCLQKCANCGAEVCSTLDCGDVYDPGYCGTLENYGCGTNDVYCIDCIESTCSECHNLPDDCDCCKDCNMHECECEVCGECGEKVKDCECNHCEQCGGIAGECDCVDMSNEDEEEDE